MVHKTSEEDLQPPTRPSNTHPQAHSRPHTPFPPCPYAQDAHAAYAEDWTKKAPKWQAFEITATATCQSTKLVPRPHYKDAYDDDEEEYPKKGEKEPKKGDKDGDKVRLSSATDQS